MSIAGIALRQSKLANACFLILSVAGVVACFNLPIEVYPRVAAARARVETVWPGAATAEVERFVTRRVEEQIAGLRGVDWYRSESTANLSLVVLRFLDGSSSADVEAAISTLRSRLQGIKDLPAGCEPPVVSRIKLDEDEPFLRVCVTDTDGRGPVVLRRAARDLQDGLSEISGVSGVRLQGAGEPELRVLLNREALEDAGLSVADVAAVLRRSAPSIPIGSIGNEREEYAIRFAGDLESLEQLKSVVIRKDPAGAHVYLRELATFEEGLSRDFVRARFRGDRCIVVEVTKTAGSNILATRKSVLAFLERFKKEKSPSGIGVEVAVDITPWISNALNVMQQNLLAGCVLVLLVLGLFMDWRGSILVLAGIPFSFLCTLTCMHALGITLNTASVFGLVLVSGLIVDDAIVVLENIHRHMQSDLSRREAIVRGVGEVILPVATSALTTIVAFLPIALIQGGIGSLFTAVPIVVAIALAASLFECLIVLPGHVLHFGSGTRTERGFAEFSLPLAREVRRGLNWVGARLSDMYIACLGSLLRFRYLVALLLVVIVAVVVAAQRGIRLETLPAEFPMAMINFVTPPESSLEETDRTAARLGELLDQLSREQGLIHNFITSAGMQLTDQQFAVQQSNLGMIWVQFNPDFTARKDPGSLLALLREAIRKHAEENEDIQLESFTVAPMGTGFEATEGVVIRVEHVDVAVCRSVAGELKNRLSRIPGLTAIGDSLRHGPLQLSVRAVEPECSEFGLTESDVAMSVRAAMEGVVAANLRNPHHQEELPIRVVLDQAWRKDLNDLMAIEIRTPTGASPLVQELVAPYYEQHYASMHHNNGRPSIVVSAEIQGKPVDASGRPIDVGYVHRELRDELAELESRHLGLKVVFGGGYAQRQATFGQLQLAGVLAAGLIYLVLVGQFRSYMQPFLILLTLLFSLIGVVAGLLAHDYAFSVVSAVALVGLFGVAVNDAILLISFLNDEPRGGPDRLQPVLAACRVRFRPILATTITTVAGLLPMAIGLRGYSPLWSPFAACFCYGLSAATLLTLAMVPCFYMIFEDVGRIPSWLWRSLRASDSSPTAPIAVNEES